MSFSLSPAVTTREIDLSAVVGSAVSTFSAFAGKFHWGPVNEPMLISDETDLVQTFGYPDNDNAVDFFTMASFLAYSSGAWVTRVGNDKMTNASLQSGPVSVINSESLNNQAGSLSTASLFAKYPGQVGNSLGVSICSSKTQYKFVFESPTAGEKGTHDIVFDFKDTNKPENGVKSKVIKYTKTTDDLTKFVSIGDYLVIDGMKYGIVAVSATTVTLDRLYIGQAKPKEIYRLWKYANEVKNAPEANNFHLIIFDTVGYFKQKGSILETFENLSTNVNSVDDQGQNNFWSNVVNRESNYLYGGEVSPANVSDKMATTKELTGGNNQQSTLGLDEYIKAYTLYRDAELYNTPIIIAGEAVTSLDAEGSILANYIIQSVAEYRKDTFVFISPPLEAVLNNRGKEDQACVTARKGLGSTSYATMDNNWKYMYDKYNDTFRWVPCNGDHAGLYAQNDRERDPWVSAAGTSKGRMKNVVKFAWNPDKPARDVLYSNDINPMFIMAIVGPVLFGDKTLLGKNTALSRVNVRRLLIVLEKTIASAAVDMLFEFNDEFTQRRFVSMVEPFLKDAQGRRGLTAYKVIADETVNTAQVVQNNSFVGQIYIKPNYTISDIRLDFVVVNASASFEEIVGSY